MGWLFLLLLILLLGYIVYQVILAEQGTDATSDAGEPKLPYRLKRYFFTRSEQEFFNILNAKIDAQRYTVFPKVRMGDYLDIDLPKGQRHAYWARIRSRHIDYVIWDLVEKQLIAAIELDGRSHNHHQAQKADGFKDSVFKAVGLPLHRVRVGSNFYDEIDHILQTFQK